MCEGVQVACVTSITSSWVSYASLIVTIYTRTFVRSDVTVTYILLPTGAWGPFVYLVGWDDSTAYMYSSELNFAAPHAGGNVDRICGMNLRCVIPVVLVQ